MQVPVRIVVARRQQACSVRHVIIVAAQHMSVKGILSQKHDYPQSLKLCSRRAPTRSSTENTDKHWRISVALDNFAHCTPARSNPAR